MRYDCALQEGRERLNRGYHGKGGGRVWLVDNIGRDLGVVPCPVLPGDLELTFFSAVSWGCLFGIVLWVVRLWGVLIFCSNVTLGGAEPA